MTDDLPITKEPKRSDEYIKLLDELKQSFITAENMVMKLYKQGKKDGLPSNIIRDDIVTALSTRVKRRRLYELLPLELKRHYTVNNSESALSAQLDDDKGVEREPITTDDDVNDYEIPKVYKLKQILIDKLDKLKNQLGELRDSVKIRHYVADDPKIMEELVDGVKSFHALLDPEAYPEKERKKLLKWVKEIETFYKRHQNIFASNEAPTVDRINIETGKIEKHKMTEEELDELFPQILKEFRYIIEHFPFLLGLNKNFEAVEEHYRAKRAYMLHDRLSESA